MLIYFMFFLHCKWFFFRKTIFSLSNISHPPYPSFLASVPILYHFLYLSPYVLKKKKKVDVGGGGGYYGWWMYNFQENVESVYLAVVNLTQRSTQVTGPDLCGSWTEFFSWPSSYCPLILPFLFQTVFITFTVSIYFTVICFLKDNKQYIL